MFSLVHHVLAPCVLGCFTVKKKEKKYTFFFFGMLLKERVQTRKTAHVGS